MMFNSDDDNNITIDTNNTNKMQSVSARFASDVSLTGIMSFCIFP